MKLFSKDGSRCNAAKDQVSLMLDAGWSKTAPDLKKELETAATTDETSVDEATDPEVDKPEDVEVKVEESVEEVIKAPKAKTAKKIIPKRK